MATKYLLLTKKDNQLVDPNQYTLDQLRERVYEIKKEKNLSDEEMNDTYTYYEIDGGVSTEENTAGAQEGNKDEFKSTSENDSLYGFTNANMMAKQTIGDDIAGWNKVLSNLKGIPADLNLSDYKDCLILSNDNKGDWAIRKNCIRLLYLYTEFMKFYAECTSKNVPAGLRGYLKTTNSWFAATRDEESLEVIKTDMKSILGYMLKHLNAYTNGDDSTNERQEVYDEIEDFDDEIRNLHTLLDDVDDTDFDADAKTWAKNDSSFKAFCGDKPPTGKLVSEYLKDMATNKYHLNRIKLDFTNEDSSPEWMSPEDQETDNVRLSDNVDDYLDTSYTKIFDDDEKAKLDEIIRKFKSGDENFNQAAAQSEINKLVNDATSKLKTSLEIFFGFMGIKTQGVINNFMHGVHRLKEEEYKVNWTKLVDNFKEEMERKIKTYERAHSGDMTKEHRDACVQKLSELITISDQMRKAIEAADGDTLLSHAKQIATVIKQVQEMTAAAKKSFSQGQQ